jgi:hypothetical protein
MFSWGFDPGESFFAFLHFRGCASRIYMTKVINNNANWETNTMNLLKIALCVAIVTIAAAFFVLSKNTYATDGGYNVFIPHIGGYHFSTINQGI